MCDFGTSNMAIAFWINIVKLNHLTVVAKYTVTKAPAGTDVLGLVTVL